MFQIKMYEIRKWILIFLVSFGLILFVSPIINAQSTTPPPESSTTTPPSSNSVETTQPELKTRKVIVPTDNEGKVGLGLRSNRHFEVEVSGLKEAIKKKKLILEKFYYI